MFLTGFKAVVGFATGSLGILAEALHSTLDLGAATMTYAAVRIAARAGEWIGYRDILLRTDAVAALAVAVIVLWVAYKLGSATLDALLDSAPEGVAQHIAQEAHRVPGVMDCRHVRVRQVGPVIFVDMVIEVPRTMSLEQAHAAVSQVEDRVRAVTAAGRYRGSLRACRDP